MNRRVRFGFVLTEEEKRVLSQMALCEGGLSEAALLRRLIHRAAQAQGLETSAHTLRSGTGPSSRPSPGHTGIDPQ